MRTLISEVDILARVRELAFQIAADDSTPPVVLGILKGAVPFMMELLRQFPEDYAQSADWDFVDASSYAGEVSTGIVKIDRGPVMDCSGRPVLVVDGIVDTGRTIDAVLRHLHTLSPSTVRVATLLDKPSRRVVSVPVDYCGFEIDDHFVVGFGMDVDQCYRSLRFIGVVDDDTEV